MITSFTYTNAKGETTVRVCNVVYESDTEIRGFDYNLLDRSEQAAVNAVYGPDRRPSPVPAAAPRMTEADYGALGIGKDVFKKAYRIFKKAAMK